MKPRLVLAGLGHSHLFVLEAAVQGKLPPCELVVCTGETHHVYSGMVPGWLGGRYDAAEVSLAVAPLIQAVGGTWRQAHVTDVNPSARIVTLADGSTERYDLCSVAVGSVPTGLDLPGAREYAIPLKPLGNIHRILDRLETLATSRGGDVVVVGGGAAGVEIVLGVVARLRRVDAADRVRVTLVLREAEPVADRGHRVVRRVVRALARAGVQVRAEADVVGVTPDTVILYTATGDEAVAADLVVWATGPAAAPWLAGTGLPTDRHGFLLVDDHLRSLGDANVLAAGDCASLNTHRETDKAGVYAVRMGPRLVATMCHALGGGPSPAGYTPQRHWLALLNTGDGSAIASRNGLVLEGAWAMHWKDRIDRAFMGRFASLAAHTPQPRNMP